MNDDITLKVGDSFTNGKRNFEIVGIELYYDSYDDEWLTVVNLRDGEGRGITSTLDRIARGIESGKFRLNEANV